MWPVFSENCSSAQDIARSLPGSPPADAFPLKLVAADRAWVCIFLFRVTEPCWMKSHQNPIESDDISIVSHDISILMGIFTTNALRCHQTWLENGPLKSVMFVSTPALIGAFSSTPCLMTPEGTRFEWDEHAIYQRFRGLVGT